MACRLVKEETVLHGVCVSDCVCVCVCARARTCVRTCMRVCHCVKAFAYYHKALACCLCVGSHDLPVATKYLLFVQTVVTGHKIFNFRPQNTCMLFTLLPQNTCTLFMCGFDYNYVTDYEQIKMSFMLQIMNQLR